MILSLSHLLHNSGYCLFFIKCVLKISECLIVNVIIELLKYCGFCDQSQILPELRVTYY